MRFQLLLCTPGGTCVLRLNDILLVSSGRVVKAVCVEDERRKDE